MCRKNPQFKPAGKPAHCGARARGLRRDNGWLLLLASLAVHAAILLLLPFPTPTALAPPLAILLALNKPPAVEEAAQQAGGQPELLPDAKPRPEFDQQANARPQSRQLPEVEEESSSTASADAPVPVHVEPRPRPQLERQPAQLPGPLPKPDPSAKPEPQPQADVGALLMEYAGTVKAQVLSQKYYPAIAERLGHTGDVKIGFTITADGELAGIRIKTSSGWDELDEAAAQAVRGAAPFDPIPTKAARDELSLAITLMYTLD